jgi:hypothetical protein
VTGRKSYGRVTSLNEAQAAFRAEYEARKNAGGCGQADPDGIAADLTVPERMLLFCIASDTDWATGGVTHAHGAAHDGQESG